MSAVAEERVEGLPVADAPTRKNARLRRLASQGGPPLYEQHDAARPGIKQERSKAGRAAAVDQSTVKNWGARYNREARLNALHELTLARVPLDAIAERFGVTVRTVSNWKRELHERYRDEACLLDPMRFFGQTIAHYGSIKAAGWRLYRTGETSAEKLAGLRVVLQAESDLHRFLGLSGFYRECRFSPHQKFEWERNDDSVGHLADGLVSELAR